jgi:hypothetical protein
MSSSSARRTYDTDSIVFRRMFAYDLSNNPFSTGFVLTSLTKGVVTFCNINVSLSSIGVPNLPDQLSTLTGVLQSAINAFAPTLPSTPDLFLPSTVTGLGTAGYVSTATLLSTVDNLASIGYISSSQLTSTVEGIFSQTQLSPAELTSSIEGLGTVGYVSSLQLLSTVEGLGSIGYISSSQFQSSILAVGGTIRSSFSTMLVGNYSNVGFLYSNIPGGSNLRSIEFTFGSTFVQKITDTSKLDIEFKPNIQFAYYDFVNGPREFRSYFVAGGENILDYNRVLASTTFSYYIENSFAINLPFFFKNDLRFQIQDTNIFSSIRAFGEHSSFSLWHEIPNPAPSQNQFFASPDQPTCVNVVLDNTFTP